MTSKLGTSEGFTYTYDPTATRGNRIKQMRLDGTLLRAAHILLATGSSPRRLPVPGAGLAGISDDFFHLCEAPARVALVGGGGWLLYQRGFGTLVADGRLRIFWQCL